MLVSVSEMLLSSDPSESEMVMSRGSRSSSPIDPSGAPRSIAVGENRKCRLPETSTKPPSPNVLPPRALMLPKKRVTRSDQMITLPPLPPVSASARMTAPPPIVV